MFEKSFYSDDINVDITSNVIDILQDLIDDGLNIQCFTIGYKTLKAAGATNTDNNIALFISANHNEAGGDPNWTPEYRYLDYNKLLPYLSRVIFYIEDEGRKVDANFQCRIHKGNRQKVIFKELEDISNDDLNSMKLIGQLDSISIRFKLPHLGIYI